MKGIAGGTNPPRGGFVLGPAPHLPPGAAATQRRMLCRQAAGGKQSVASEGSLLGIAESCNDRIFAYMLLYIILFLTPGNTRNPFRHLR